MNFFGITSRGTMAVVAAAVSSSVLGFLILVVTGWIGVPTGPNWPLDIAVILSIIFFWAPAFALVPAAILGFALERPFARRLIAHRDGGFVVHLLVVLTAALLLWLLLRITVVLTGPQQDIRDPLSLAAFAIVGLCSAMSWWFLVVVPGRRT